MGRERTGWGARQQLIGRDGLDLEVGRWLAEIKYSVCPCPREARRIILSPI